MGKNTNSNRVKPFLRWAGGKTHSIQFLLQHLPPALYHINRYFEPFLGAGSLFFSLRPKKAILSDINKDLIECYKAIQKNPILMHKYLSAFLRKNNEIYYYEMRRKYNSSNHSICRAALFLYLNKTCFNGIWRVNKKGEFNVPYGKQDHPYVPTKNELNRISETLSQVEIIHRNYKDIINHVQEGDFVYLDPPYPPLNSTSNFTQYNTEDFTREDHKEMALFSRELTRRGCYVLISNSDTEYIRSLFTNDFYVFELEVTRLIRADGHRYKVKEIAITNYEVE